MICTFWCWRWFLHHICKIWTVMFKSIKSGPSLLRKNMFSEKGIGKKLLQRLTNFTFFHKTHRINIRKWAVAYSIQVAPKNFRRKWEIRDVIDGDRWLTVREVAEKNADFQRLRYMTFYLKIKIRVVSVHDGFQDIWLVYGKESRIAVYLQFILKETDRRFISLFGQDCYNWWKLVLLLWSRKKQQSSQWQNTNSPHRKKRKLQNLLKRIGSFFL